MTIINDNPKLDMTYDLSELDWTDNLSQHEDEMIGDISQFENDMIDDFSQFENDFNLYLKYFKDHHSTTSSDDYFSNDYISDDPAPDLSIVSEELVLPVNPVESVSQDIPTNPKEWMVTDTTSKRKRPPRLFEFLILLLQKSHYASYASYKDKSRGLFEIHEPEKVANLWQQIKNRQSHQQMTYDKFARAIRWYYKEDIMRKTNARYTFQFSPKTLEGITTDENNNTIINLST